MSSEATQHHAICPLCTRVVTKEGREDAASVVENHNDQMHDGDDVAQVVGPTRDDLNEFMDGVEEEHGPEVYGEIGAHIVDVDPWGVLNA